MAGRWRGERVAELEREVRERDPHLAERLHTVIELMASLRDAAARVADLEREVVAARGAPDPQFS